MTTIINGEALETLRTMPDNYVDSIVTDPPYELGFMGKKWDGSGIAFSVELWTECLRVLKPGGHLLSFGGSRTWHRMASAIEDAGFELRDSIAWLYGSGFPKSLDVSKAIDKAAGAERVVIDRAVTPFKVDAAASRGTSLQGSVNGDFSKQVDERGYRYTEITAPATPAAEQWQGWGTALKPAFEPIVVARKPLSGTVAANVQAHGTGALNIDGCRIGAEERTYSTDSGMNARRFAHDARPADYGRGRGETATVTGRWPANVVLDKSQAAVLDEQSGTLTSGKVAKGGFSGEFQQEIYGRYARNEIREETVYGDSGGASRFFPTFKYQAKAPKRERPRVNGTAHPTVKPLELMRWLVRLVTPPNGVVLDPFLGSGTTAQAAELEGFECIGIEREAEYIDLINARLNPEQEAA